MPKKSSVLIILIEISLIGLLLGLLFVSYKVTAQEIPLELTNETFELEILSKNSEIYDLEYDYFIANGKYQNSFPNNKKLPYTLLPDTEIEIHEYKTSKGENGYQTIYRNGNYTKSYGYGEEAIDRTWDWRLPTSS